MRTRLLVLIVLTLPAAVEAAEHPALAKARALYNAADYDGAISSASLARSDPASADAAALVAARAHLERFRRMNDPVDLTSARDALAGVRSPALSARDQVDLLVGLGQALYLTDSFGAAAELFETALARASLLPDRDRLLLLDWWATAMDRQAQTVVPGNREALHRTVAARMDEELERDAASVPANYWLPVALRGAGQIERAWGAAVAAWVRASLAPSTSAVLRSDLDRFVTTVLIPERALSWPAAEQLVAADGLRAEWNAVKEQWK
jgi:hypothetical protein